MDWLDLLMVQRTLKSLLQHHSSKASILLCSAFFTVQFSHPYMTNGKTIALTRQTFVGKVMSLLLNKLALELKPKTRDLREKKLPELTEVSWLDWVSLQWLNFLCDAECRLGNKFSFYHFFSGLWLQAPPCPTEQLGWWFSRMDVFLHLLPRALCRISTLSGEKRASQLAQW